MRSKYFENYENNSVFQIYQLANFFLFAYFWGQSKMNGGNFNYFKQSKIAFTAYSSEIWSQIAHKYCRRITLSQ